MVDISGLPKAQVLAALYNRAIALGKGHLHYTPEDLPLEDAEALLAEGTYFDYLKGRVMKVDLSKDDSFEEHLYDRDNGPGAAAEAIAPLRS
jgi:hypothetical protein